MVNEADTTQQGVEARRTRSTFVLMQQQQYGPFGLKKETATAVWQKAADKERYDQRPAYEEGNMHTQAE
ncbi:hypothetical protein PMZ80_005743 [Knufia obscura]|uniref:Uncharacterized protein n=1 Tax=Knufia obscura TaxID=1635080 RepID=A0ABR0RMF9_9EURO|nr:hypothetical protein PMZ80_005743 [Knufia obscura]